MLDASDNWAWLGAWEPIHISVEWERYTVTIPVEAGRAGNFLDGAQPTPDSPPAGVGLHGSRPVATPHAQLHW